MIDRGFRGYHFTILGCGSSPGVPRIGLDWGDCDSRNPKNRRRRSSLLIERYGEYGKTIIVVDTGPDFREQMISANVAFADGVIYTHPHADHIHGIDDLRSFVINRRERVQIWADDRTSIKLHEAFGYCFETPKGSRYPPILEENRIVAGQEFKVSGQGGPIAIMPYHQIHGDIYSLGFRIGSLAYSSDVSAFDQGAFHYLKNLDILILDALQYKEHHSHFSLKQALSCIDECKTKCAILTHMHIALDYETVKAGTPSHVNPGYDGMVIEIPES
ncbi:MBL fold metallo-hydrolase [Candidatus Endowatersipora endosymbiont of Watersipora subatra]|uniref:MBL fold metallo-hydrolase n=1 Tax=Candidatus Endowatersipora endosymbiont of Watersipora subatra TaxID=3077946 RepID=UPI00312C6E34